MRIGNCENEWRSQHFVLLLLEKLCVCCTSISDSCTPYIDVLFVNIIMNFSLAVDLLMVIIISQHVNSSNMLKRCGTVDI